MIFAFDLDRTMIFSERALNELNGIGSAKCTVIEERSKGVSTTVVSYIPKYAYDCLNQMDVLENVFLVPTTTRSVQQFKCISYFKDLEWTICANGGVILHNGRKLPSWNKVIQGLVAEANETYEKVSKSLNKLNYITSKCRKVDETFIFCKTKDVEKTTEFLDTFLKETPCTYTIQGNKVYIMHEGISKEAAIKFVSERVHADRIITFGDGKLDKNMVLMGNPGFLAVNSSLYKLMSKSELSKSNIKVKGKGPHATNEVLYEIQKLIDSTPKYCILKSN